MRICRNTESEFNTRILIFRTYIKQRASEIYHFNPKKIPKTVIIKDQIEIRKIQDRNSKYKLYKTK